jgi:ATP-dependent helicase/nuclease subunit A
MTRQPPDQAARTAITTRLDETFLVEAGAGSGKTTSLVNRMVELIKSGRCRPDTLAAVTFTRKAAAELRERFQEKLEKACREETEPAAKEWLSRALAELDRAFIGTIHSFCARLLRERPVEAGLAPDFSEIEGMEENLLLEAAWEEYLLAVRLENPPALDRVRGLDISPQDLKDAYARLALYPDVTFRAEPYPYPDLDPARRELNQLLDVAELNLPRQEPDGGYDELQRLLRQALRWRRFFDPGENRNLLRILARLDRSPRLTQKKWGDRDTALQVDSLFCSFRDNTVRPVLREWRRYRYPIMLDFLLPAARHFEKARREENRLNFQDLLMYTARLLKENPEVRTYFRQRFTHLLVDEFQDTDPIQAEIMMYLAGSDPEEQNWTRLKPRPGALFVVGDPKQSIYRFRRADIDTYNQVRDIIKNSGGEILHLTANFRSLPQIIDFANHTFGELFSQSRPPYQAEPVTMDTWREPAPASGLLKIELTPAPRNSQEYIVAQDAATIASWIRHCLDGGLALRRSDEEEARGLTATPVPGDFMILVRYKSRLAQYARALEKYGIPFTLSGESDIAASRELQELLYLLMALADPDNPVPLVAVLRGLFFGLSDDQLYRYRSCGGTFFLHAAVPGGAPADVAAAFAPVLAKLSLYHRWSRDLPPGAALESITADLGLLPYTLAGSLGKGNAGYLLQFIELVRAREVEGETGFAAMVAFFSQLLEAGLEEELDITAGTAPAVRIMNLHRAKGLEAPVVILANPAKTVDRDPDLHVSRTDTICGYLRISRQQGRRREILAEPPDWEIRQAEEDSYRRAEDIRLLYVAATRARNLLVISTYPAKPQLSPWQPLEPFLPKEVAVLENPEPGFPLQPPPAEPVTPELLRSAAEQLRADLEKAAVASYQKLTVTDLSKDSKAPRRFHTGKGMSFGNVIHQALEVLTRDRGRTDLEQLIPALLAAHACPADEKKEVIDLLARVQETALWRRALASPELLCEVPFGVFADDTYLTGTVDLAFREEGGWVLADYKTDAVKDEIHLEQLVDYYRPQVAEYTRRWEEITGEKVKESGLFFVSVLEYVTLQV